MKQFKYLIIIVLCLLVGHVYAMATYTIYPEVEAQPWRYSGTGMTWAEAHDSVGGVYSHPTNGLAMISETENPDLLLGLYRGIKIYNTSVIPTGEVVSGVKISFVATGTFSGYGELALTGGRTISNTTVVAGDMVNFTNVEYASRTSISGIPYNSVTRTNITLTNLTFLNRGSVAYTPIFFRIGSDVDNIAPAWVANQYIGVIAFNATDNASAAQKNFMEVTTYNVAPTTEFVGDILTSTSPLKVNFADLSNETPTSWYWDFGDGNTSTEQYPNHTYYAVGSYDVKHRSTNVIGSSWNNKTGYITVTSPPSQGTLTTYPWRYDNVTRILPTSTITAQEGNSISATICRDEFEPMAFLMKATGNVTGITMTAPTLSDGDGNTIPSSAIDIKTVKVWYTARNPAYDDIYQATEMWTLDPELLLNDDHLVSVNTTLQQNKLWIMYPNHTYGYFKISNSTDVIPYDAVWDDAATLQPFNLVNENKEIWITVHVPNETSSGTYNGTIQITNVNGDSIGNMTLAVVVPPFDLEQNPLIAGLYYPTQLHDAARLGITATNKTQTEYLQDLINMKNHGILYPMNAQEASGYANGQNGTLMNVTLDLYGQAGLPKDKLFWQGWSVSTYYNYNTAVNQTLLTTQVGYGKDKAIGAGFEKFYVYGGEEVSDANLLHNQSIAYTLLHDNGSYVINALNEDVFSIVGSTLDILNTAYPHNLTKANQWHSAGKKIVSYANPQMGSENASCYRDRYGFSLWNDSYDGFMLWVYQYHVGGGHIWNDWEKGLPTTHYRAEVSAYPTKNGYVNTVQFEGLREAVDDVRYAQTLVHTDGDDNTTAINIVRSGLAAGALSNTTRQQLIGQILYDGGYTPLVVSFTKNQTSGVIPLAVQFNDTSTGSPTSWNWSFGDANWTNTTVAADRNVTHTYPSVGVYNVSLTVSNSFGANQSANQTVTVTAVTPTPTPTTTTAGRIGGANTQIFTGMMMLLLLPLVLIAGFVLLILNGKGRSVDPSLLLMGVVAIILVVVVFWIVFAVNGNG